MNWDELGNLAQTTNSRGTKQVRKKRKKKMAGKIELFAKKL